MAYAHADSNEASTLQRTLPRKFTMGPLRRWHFLTVHRVKKYGLTMMGVYATERAVGTTVNKYSDCR